MSVSESNGALTSADLEALRSALSALQEQNLADLELAKATLAQLAEEHITSDPSLREVATNAEYMVADASDILLRIDQALARIDDGDYGHCQSCGQPIPLARLELRPYGTRCVACSP